MSAMHKLPTARVRQGGFTFFELVMVIMMMGILSVGLTKFIGLSVEGYVDTANRQEMASTLVIATEKLSRGLRRALPNSIRIGGSAPGSDNCVELIPVLVATRYINAPIGGSGTTIDAVAHGGPVLIRAQAALYPIDTADLYTPTDSSPSSITDAQANFVTGSNTIVVALGAAHEFRARSPNKRVYGVDQPMAWCQPTGSDRLYQYSDYGFNAVSVLPPVGGTRDVLVTGLDATQPIAFNYASATRSRNAVVTVEMAALGGDEQFTLGHEVQIRNVP